jgi:hypothetical protein
MATARLGRAVAFLIFHRIEAGEPPRFSLLKGPVPAPCRKGWTVSLAALPRLAIMGVSPPFRASLVQGGRSPSPMIGPYLRHSPTHFASGQKSMGAIAFGSILRRETAP